jgi:hypothetical protein
VYAIFVCWTLFAVFVYSRYSQLGDARSYLTGAYDDEASARTYFVTQVATSIIGLVHVDVLAHLAFSLFAASGVAYLVGQARLHGSYRWPLLAILLVPSFGVWASVVGRESLYIGLLGYFMGAIIGLLPRAQFREARVRPVVRGRDDLHPCTLRRGDGLVLPDGLDADARAARRPEPRRTGVVAAGARNDRGHHRVAATG